MKKNCKYCIVSNAFHSKTQELFTLDIHGFQLKLSLSLQNLKKFYEKCPNFLSFIFIQDIDLFLVPSDTKSHLMLLGLIRSSFSTFKAPLYDASNVFTYSWK